jgi:alpha-ketoglutarate-dependent taurine dioxygenase
MADESKPSIRDAHWTSRRATARHSVGIRTSPLYPDCSMPLLLQPVAGAPDVVSWAAPRCSDLQELLSRHGALLFRGFSLASQGSLEDFIRAIAGQPLSYRERSSPRSVVAGKIYTSTEYPADQRIFIHNENSYADVFPGVIAFHCVVAPTEGGQTPLADCRKVLEGLPARIRDRFACEGVLYVRNFSADVGLSWSAAFGSDEPDEVQRRLSEWGYTVTWCGNRLHTRRIGPAVIRHPQSGEDIWFNHAAFFHVSTLAAPLRDSLLALFGEDGLPNQTYYGGGDSIDGDTLDAIRGAYHAETVMFAWQAGDVLLVDNIAVAHGRNAFRGPRRVVVGMARACEAAREDNAWRVRLRS